MLLHRPIATALLLLLAASPVSLVVVHALEAHSHEDHAEASRTPATCEVLSEIVVHGHSHAGEPASTDHDHDLLPTPAPRHESREPAMAVPPMATVELTRAPASSPLLRSLSPPDPAGAGPPRLHRLCTLLI